MGPASAPVSPAAAPDGASVGTYHPPRMTDLRKVTTPILLHLLKGEVRLPIARWIARQHGGDVTLASVPGRGTTATVRLPIAR